MFGTILTTVTTIMHLFVFWRISTIPFVRRHFSKNQIILVALLLWGVFVIGRFYGHDKSGLPAMILELFAMNWLAILFLLTLSLLVVDILTLFGFLFRRRSSSLRGLALIIGVLLSFTALFQGFRSPEIVEYKVPIPNLPEQLEETVIVALSDMHLGTLLNKNWLQARISQVQELQPDVIVLLGDIFEGHGAEESSFIEIFKQLSAPLGIYAVTGNHEFHGSSKKQLFVDAGFTLLDDRWKEINPGLIIAGVDDLTSARRRNLDEDSLEKALDNRPQGATILLSHTPWYFEQAEKAGVDLMLCGHTHGGQIWPFDYLVQSRYPLLEGQYKVRNLTVIVSRGTGTWGPRMRLWHSGEISKITLIRQKQID